MKRIPIGLAVLLLNAFSNASPTNGRDRHDCPESIDVTETASVIDTTWEVAIDKGRTGYYLDNVGFYSGHPGKMATLVPDRSTDSAKERKSIWRFANNIPTDYWIACSYLNTRLQVIKKLPSEITTCQVVHQLLPSGALLKVKSVICQ